MNTIKSIWEATCESGKPFPELEGEQRAEIAIVGGGITGLTAAYILGQAGRDVLLLEARSIGLGTTGNSTGNLYVTVDEHLSHIRKKWNDKVMKDVVASRNAALDFIGNLIRQHSIECDFSRQPFTYFAEKMDKEAEKFFEDELDAMEVCGLKPQLLGDAGLPYTTVKALRAGNQAQFHPLKYARALAQLAAGKCRIFEQSRMMDLDEKNGVLTTPKGKVKAEKIILATHTPVGVYAVHTVLGPYREFGVAGELVTGEFPRGIFWGVNDPKRSIRAFKQGEKNYVMVIGDKFKTGQHGDTQEYIDHLTGYLNDRLDISAPKYVWGGQHYRSADSLPCIGKHSEQVYFLTGFATDGLVYGTLAAMIVADQLSGKPNPWEETFKAGRFTPVKSAKEFITENANNLVQYMKDVPWNVDAAELNEIKPGDGKVIEKDQEKIGVYKDDAGELHAVSAVCTHMKCVVNWNQSEKSWDCPCHGSRFGIDGKVIEGPAYSDLPRKTIKKKT